MTCPGPLSRSAAKPAEPRCLTARSPAFITKLSCLDNHAGEAEGWATGLSDQASACTEMEEARGAVSRCGLLFGTVPPPSHQLFPRAIKSSLTPRSKFSHLETGSLLQDLTRWDSFVKLLSLVNLDLCVPMGLSQSPPAPVAAAFLG